MESKTNIQVFLDKYKTLESLVRRRYHLTDKSKSPIRYLSQQRAFSSVATELDYCRELRNLMSHFPGTDDSVQPSDRLIELLDQTTQKVQNPPRAGQKAIPRERILRANMKDYVLPIMRKMNENVFTHIPIVENDRVVGVFSENTIFSYLADEEIVEIEETTTFSDLSDYLPLNAHKAESFRFVSKKTLMAEVVQLFSEAVEKGDRIGLVLVTENGKPNEKLMGILTAWDMAGI